MKSTHAALPALLATLGLATGHLASRAELSEAQARGADLQVQNADLTQRVELLERQVTELTAKLQTVSEDVSDQRQLVDQTVSYTGRQAAAAKKLMDSLDASEQAGFTAGINPRSREVLLEGWRAQAREAQEGLPGVEDEKARSGRR